MKRISPTNEAINEGETWTEAGLTFEELARQSYGGNGAYFATGVVEGHPIEQVYFQWGKDGEPTGMFLLTTDELAAMAWVASGTLWSVLLAQQPELVRNAVTGEWERKDS
jgi:hypothetical protein